MRVAFLHMYITSCQNITIFEKMLEDENFDPFFIVNPDVYRSKENFDFQYQRTLLQLREKYGAERVLEGYDYENNEYIDYTDSFDVMTTNNPYDAMAHPYFQIKYWADKYIPIFYISYFYMGRCNVSVDNLKMPEFNMFWKIFSENNSVKQLAGKYQKIKGKNIVVSGYPKLDGLANITPQLRKRKCVIIAPHHTIFDSDTQCGGFLEYSDDLLALPEKYPDIDFVFRPHPLLIQNLKKQEFWGEEKTEKYLGKILSFQNVRYSQEGDYCKLFVNSDALIHDCGSFMAEYLCTNHPCAYYLRSTLNISKTWTSFGKKCLDAHYLIKEATDFYKFIDNVVIANNDTKKDMRNKFAQKEIMINYPNATNTIYEYICKELNNK